MIAGLLFATHDAEDRAGALTATLPFGGVTLIEYQARLLMQAGAGQIIVVVSRLVPELLGAIARIGKRGVTVDTVRSAAEAAAKIHPLSRVLVLADGLVTTEAVIAPLAREGADTLLVVDEADAPATFERVGGRAAWAGVARLEPQRLTEVATLPRDYDLQSALLRVAAQARAQHLLLTDRELKQGHGIEHRAAALDLRGDAVMASALSGRRAWFDRWIVAPLARIVMPRLTRGAVPTVPVAVGAAALAVLGVIAIGWGHGGIGVMLMLAGTIAAAIAAALAWLRDELRLGRALAIGVMVLPAAGLLLYGRAIDHASGEISGGLLALFAVMAAGLAERAADEHHRRRWWGTSPGYLTVLLPFALTGWPMTGLSAVALYASATLAHAIEILRRHA